MSKDNVLDMQEITAMKEMEEQAAAPTPAQVAGELVETVDTEIVPKAIDQTFDSALSEHNPGSLGRKWVESFKSFAESPVSYGAVAGQALAGILGGSQAGAAASPIAMEFQKMANQRYIADRKIKASQTAGSQFDAPTGFVLKGTNTPVTYNKQTATYSLNGKPVAADQVENVQARESTRKNERAEKNLERRDRSLDQRDRSFNLARDKFDYTKSEEAELSEVDARFMGDAATTMDAADQIIERFRKVNTGPASGRAQRVAQVFGVAPGDFVAARQEASLFLGDYVRLMSGAAATDNERAFYEKNLPTDKDTEQDLIVKARNVKRYVEQKAKTRLEAMRKYKGQGLDVDFKDRSKRPGASPKASAPTGETVRVRNKQTGQVGSIPKANLGKALSSGQFERVK